MREPPPKVAVPPTAAIAMSIGIAVVGIALGVVALVITEADDELQRILAVAGIVAGLVAGIAAGVALARRRRVLSYLAVYGAREELRLAGELLEPRPNDIDRRQRAQRLLEQTSDSFARLIAAGAVEEAYELQAARLALERTLAKGEL